MKDLLGGKNVSVRVGTGLGIGVGRESSREEQRARSRKGKELKTVFLLLPLVFFHRAEARWLTMQESGSIVEKFHIEYQIQKNGASTQTIDYAVKIQSEDAKVSAGVFSIDYNASVDEVEVLEAYTENGASKIKVEPAAIEDRDKGEAKDYDAMKARSVVFPQVQIGSRLFIRYRVKTLKPVVEGRWSTELAFGPSYFIKDFRAVFRSEVPLNFEVRDPRKLIFVKQIDPRHIEVNNRRILPGWVHAEKDPYFHPLGNTELRVSTHGNWSKFLKSLNEDYAKILAAGVPIKLKGWIEQAKLKEEKAESIHFLLEKISEEFRYFGDWRRHNGGLVPRALDEIEKSRYGDCKDLSSLLAAMLKDLGFKASVALVRRGENPYGEEPDYKLPSLTRFNHAIVHVQDGEKTYWLDPTNPVMALEPYPDIAGRPAWVLSESKFVRIPKAEASQFEHVHNYEYTFLENDKVKVRVEAKLAKLAPYDLANDLLLLPRSEVLSHALEYFSEGQEVKSFRFLKEPNTGRRLSDMDVKLEYESGRIAFSAGKAAFWVIPDGFLQGAFYETEARESDLALSDGPYVFRGTRRLKDMRLAQEAPPPCVVESKWMNLERRVHAEGADVIITQNVELKAPYIRRAEFRSEAFKKLQAETKRCFYRTGLLIEPANGRLSLSEQ